MNLPQDPAMLMSFINMKLRDGDFEDLSELCEAYGKNIEDLIKDLANAGFEYFPNLKQFR